MKNLPGMCGAWCWILLLMFLGNISGGETQGSDPEMAAINLLVEQAIAEGQMPGAVVLVGRGDEILHFKAYGQRQVLPEPEEMTLDTVFDLASLTKPVATATSIMILVEQGKIDPQASVATYLPDFAANGKDDVTVQQLLTHTSGLIADNALRDYLQGSVETWKRIEALKLVASPGEKFIYSDVGFLVLGRIVEQVSGQPLDEFTAQHIFKPLKMDETGYRPGPELQARSAPADQQEGIWIRGIVHDPRARALEGVAGHAGVFSTAVDMSRYARMILHQGSLDDVQILQPETVQKMLVSRPVPGGIRTWGWDRQTGYSSNRGKGMSEQAIGHGGFMGTGMWIDPGLNLYVIFLSNRLHPDGKGAVNRLIGEIGTVAVKQVER